jgi:hypothetical protein
MNSTSVFRLEILDVISIEGSDLLNRWRSLPSVEIISAAMVWCLFLVRLAFRFSPAYTRAAL